MAQFGNTINQALSMYNAMSPEQIASLTEIGRAAGTYTAGDFIRSILVQMAYDSNNLTNPDDIYECVKEKLEIQCKGIAR